MSEERRPVRRRRVRAMNPRDRRIVVKVNDEEFVQLTAMAEVQDISIPRLLMRSTFAGSSQSAAKLSVLHTELRGAVRLLGRLGVLLNQIAAIANATGEMSPELNRTLSGMRDQQERLARVVDNLESTR